MYHLILFFLLPLIYSLDIPIIPKTPPYYNKPIWELGTYDDLTVNVGDTLVFYFIAAYHDVHVFTKENQLQWASCEFPDVVGIDKIVGEVVDTVMLDIGVATIPIGITQSNYTFTEETTVYFACAGGDGEHCYDGQKFEVKVVQNTNNAKPKIVSIKYKKTPIWTLLGYPDLCVKKGDRLIFKYDPVTTEHDVWMMPKPCQIENATLLADVDDGSGEGFIWSAKCPGGAYPCRVYLGCSCRPTGVGMNEACGSVADAGPGPLLHCYSGMGFYVNITRY